MGPKTGKASAEAGVCAGCTVPGVGRPIVHGRYSKVQMRPGLKGADLPRACPGGG